MSLCHLDSIPTSELFEPLGRGRRLGHVDRFAAVVVRMIQCVEREAEFVASLSHITNTFVSEG